MKFAGFTIIFIFWEVSLIASHVAANREGKCEFINEKSPLVGNVYTCKIEKAYLSSDEDETKFTITGNHQSKGRQDKGVKFVKISSSNMTVIPDQLFEKFQYIEFLNINEIGLKKLKKMKAPELKFFSANKNNLKEIPNEVFSESEFLITLSLRENEIELIGVKAFKNLNQLQELYLSSNKLIKLLAEVFSPLLNLQILSISGNQLTTIEMETFNANRNLRELLIYDNQIIAIHPQAFINQRKLFNLELHGNKCINVDFREDDNFLENIKKLLKECYNKYPPKFE